MKITSLILGAILISAASASIAGERTRCTINGVSSARCAAPPAPPAPPSPPSVPAPPAPPAPPDMIDAPAEAHAACAGKAEGSGMSWITSDKERLGGTCEKENRGMYFEVHSVRRVK